MAPPTETVIGLVVRPFGVRGEVKVRVLTDVPDRFDDLADVTLARVDGSRTVARVLSARPHQGHVLVRFKGVETLADAEALRGAEVRTDAADRPPLEADTYYTSDLIGMEVRLSNGARLGRVEDILRYPAQDLLVVGEALIPAVRAIVTNVDMSARVITIDPPDGLLPDHMAAIAADAPVAER